ncbi:MULTISPECIES: hypothetical protein [unclassified Streptomyces]|uniref:hypothetical protein n=1 Tax=unclassified Streptomyces TaxID=2593676 RepID=UPI0033B9E7AF
MRLDDEPAERLPQAVVDVPRRDVVVHGGAVVARDGEFPDRPRGGPGYRYGRVISSIA